MNKKDVIKIAEHVIEHPLFDGFTIRKSDVRIVRKDKNCAQYVVFSYYNSFDLDRGDLALQIQPAYSVRFNVLHKWFEKYSKKTLADQRDNKSIGFTGDMIGVTNEFYFLESRKDYYKDLQIIKNEVPVIAKQVFDRFSTLEGFYDYRVRDVLKGKRDFQNGGFDWIIEDLIATKIVAPQDYALVKAKILEKVEFMHNRNEPNISRYYEELPTILADLEQTDFKD